MGKILKGIITAIIIGFGTLVILQGESEIKMMLEKEKHKEASHYKKIKFTSKQINEEAKWVKKNPTRGNLVNFSDKYPEHPFAYSAREMVAAIDYKERENNLWSRIKATPNESDLVEFIYIFKNSKKISEAKNILKKLRFSNLSNNLSSSNLKKYLDQYPNDKNKESICQKLDSLYWLEARAENTEYYLSRYLFSFSKNCKGKYQKEALLNIEKIKSKEFDERTLVDKIYAGTYSQNGKIENLIVQFYELNEGIKASINIGKERYRNLDVNISNNEFTLIENNPDFEIKHLKGLLYTKNESEFIESIYYPKNLYWRAKIYKK